MISAIKQVFIPAFALSFISGVKADSDRDEGDLGYTISNGSTTDMIKYTFEDDSIMEVGYLSSENVVKFDVTVKANSYFAIGYGPSMFDTDMVMWTADGSNSKTTDLWSTSHARPSTDSQQDYTSTIQDDTSTEGVVRFISTRKLDTGDAGEDQIIELDTNLSMCFAYRKSSSSFSMHNGYGQFSMKLLSTGGASLDISLTNEVTRIKDYENHGLAMWAAWTIGGIIELLTNRYLKHYAPYHQYIHSLVGTAIVVITVMSSLSMMSSDGERHVHDYLGIVVMAIAILLLIQGMIISITSMFCDLSWKKDFTMIVRKAHKIVGFFVILLSLMTVGNGIYTYVAKSNWDELSAAGPINMGLALLTLLMIEIFYRIWLKKETPWRIPEKKMTSDQVHQLVSEGRCLMILDNLVLDMKDYCKFHPGGKFSIDGNYGRDVSKYFYGGYSMENIADKPKTRAHSNQARAVVNRFAIATLEDCVKVQQPETKISTVTKVNDTTATYTFTSSTGNPVLNWRSYYMNMDFLGKHFMVSSLINNKLKVARHYTVCHAMVPNFRQALVKLVDEHIAGDDSGVQAFKSKHLANEDQNHINLTIKDYKKQYGLSTKVGSVGSAIDKANQNSEKALQKLASNEFVVKGPMGEGLRVHKAGGTHVVFCAGTGVLCYLDVVVHLLLKNMRLLSDNQCVDNSFKLVFYVTFRTREDGIGLDLIEALERLLEFYKVTPQIYKVIRSEGGKSNGRWDARFVEEKVREIQGASKEIKRLWVCGPPAMNQLFDMTLGRIGPEIGLTPEQYTVL